MKVKEESEKVGLKLNIQKTKITASNPITSWKIDGETVETVTDFVFFFFGSKIMVTAAMKLCIIFPLVKLAQCWLWVLRDPSEQTVIMEINTH